MRVAAAVGALALVACSGPHQRADDAASAERPEAFCRRLDRVPYEGTPPVDGPLVVVAFVASAEPADIAVVRDTLADDERVAAVEFVSARAAALDYLERPGVVPDDEPSVSSSAFSASFVVTVVGADADVRSSLVDALESLPEVSGVTIAQERAVLGSLSSITVEDHLLAPWAQPPGDVGLTFASYLEPGLSGDEVWRRWLDDLDGLVEVAPPDLRVALDRLVGYHRALGETWAAFDQGDPAGVRLQRRDLEQLVGLTGPARAFELGARSVCP